ncbi:hypothetical protein ACLOJK_028399 [Asimina triloba]
MQSNCIENSVQSRHSIVHSSKKFFEAPISPDSPKTPHPHPSHCSSPLPHRFPGERSSSPEPANALSSSSSLIIPSPSQIHRREIPIARTFKRLILLIAPSLSRLDSLSIAGPASLSLSLPSLLPLPLLPGESTESPLFDLGIFCGK